MKTTARKRAAGFFTVIEMLAVISVVTVLFAMLFPAFSKVRMRTLRTQDLSNMKQFAIACFAMTTDNRAVLPIGARINAYESQGWGDCIEGGGLAGSEWAKLRDCYGLSYRVAGCNQATKPEVFQNNSRSCYRGMSYATAMDSVKISPTLKTAKGYDRTVQLYDDELVLWRSYGNRGYTANSPDKASSGGIYSIGQVVAQHYYDRNKTTMVSKGCVLPTNLFGRMTTRTLLACPSSICRPGTMYDGAHAYHGNDTESGFDTCKADTLTTPSLAVKPKCEGMAGCNMGYVDGAARWVPWADLAVLQDPYDGTKWYFMDDTVK